MTDRIHLRLLGFVALICAGPAYAQTSIAPAAPGNIPDTAARARIELIQIKDFMIELRTIEEVYFADHVGYTDSLPLLRVIASEAFPDTAHKPASPPPRLTLPAGLTIGSLTLGKGGQGWSAVVKSKSAGGPQCAIGVGMANPFAQSATEGAPFCK
jgi:hypothetical protein